MVPTTVKATDYTDEQGVEFTYTDEQGVEFTYTVINEKVTITVATLPSGIVNITIPNNINGYEVTSIGDRAFFECSSLKTVTFEEGSKLETIGQEAFYKCTSLTSIEIPTGVTSIEPHAFRYCTALKTIEIPTGVTIITVGMFTGCSSLETIEIPTGITSIENGAFYGCSSLETIEIPESVTIIGDYAFLACSSLKTVVFRINSQLETISNSAFNGKETIFKCKKDTVAYAYAKAKKMPVFEFQANVSYSNTEENDQPLIATIILNDKLYKETIRKLEDENWVYTEETLELKKIYNSNIEEVETVNLIDWVGNELKVDVNIDTKKPTIEVVYLTTEFTQEATILIVGNEVISTEILVVENGEQVEVKNGSYLLEAIKTMVKYTFDENTNINIKAKDAAGNYSDEVKIEITNIKKEIATPEIIYTPTKEEGITNKNVIAKVSFENTSEEQIEFINSADEITVEGLSAQYKFEENGKYTIYYKDIAENQENITLEVDWIDKTSPNIIGIEDGKTYTRKIEIKVADENLSEVIIVKDNEETLNYEEGMEIEEIGNYQITAKDAATNISEVNFTIEKEIIKVQGISLNTNNVEMKPEEIISLEATITPENASNKNIIWTSTNEKVAIVTNGVVIAKDVGETTILAKTEDGEQTAYCQVKVKKEVNLQGPTITEMKITPETWTNGNVEIEVIAEDENGLADAPYSINGKTWTNEKIEISKNGKYEIHAKDIFGNLTTQEIEINNIDKTSPELKVEVENNEKVSKTKEVTITAEDTLSGLSQDNQYKYCLTKNKELQNEEWLDYEFNKTFEIGEGKTGEYYLHVKEVKDNAGNETKVETIKITLDNTAPKILINNEEAKQEYRTATIKVEETSYEIVVMKDGQEIEYKENEPLKEIGSYEIIVKDEAENESKVNFEIKEFITNEKYITYEEEGKWYLGNISPETSKERFIENLDTNITGIEVKTKEQENLAEGQYVGTGMTTTIQGVEYILIVKGDTTGDGKANGQDALAILFHREGKILLEGENLQAADLNKDGKINGMDALLLLLHRERQEGYIL